VTSNPIKESFKIILKKLGLFEMAVRAYSSALNWRKIGTAFTNQRLRLSNATGGAKVPPPELLYLVAGSKEVRWFLHSGKLGFETIADVLRKNGIGLNLDKVLDFGCGCGRVLRHWRQVEKVRLFGTDYNSRLIAWCKENLPFARFGVNELAPPLTYNDDEFDFVYALSVLTHLPEELQFRWVEELKRIIRPGGYLLITTHGSHYLSELDADERRHFEDNKLVVRSWEASGTNRCATFHPEKYVREKLVDGFEVIDFIAKGARGNPEQDLYLLQKK